MDPEVTLANIRELVAFVLTGTDDNAAAELAELIQALDAWITGGGFLPLDWSVPPVWSIPPRD